jgi:hypothetical protein
MGEATPRPYINSRFPTSGNDIGKSPLAPLCQRGVFKRNRDLIIQVPVGFLLKSVLRLSYCEY